MLIVSDNETIIKEVENHDTVESIMIFMLENFGANNYFIVNKDVVVYQIIKGKIKNKGINFDPGALLIYDNYTQFLSNPTYNLIFDVGFIKYHKIIIDELTQKYPNKKLYIDKWKYKISAFSMKPLFNVDSTITKTYFDWLCNLQYTLEYGISNEDYDKINILLKDFHLPEVKNLIKKAGYSLDINSYSTDKELFHIVGKVYYSKLSELELKDTSKLIEARTIFEDYNWWVVVPENHNESIKLAKYGGMTYWCTAAQSEESKQHYHNYTVDDEGKIWNLYIFINKNDPSQKYQWSELEGDFLDWNDKKFDVEDIFDLDFIRKFYIVNNKSPWGFKNTLINYNEFLDNFVYDKNELIRLRIAKKGYGLAILVNDTSNYVKLEVAKQGYGLDILINDENKFVRQTVKSLMSN